MEKIVYLGDSITANFKALDQLTHVINMGIGGDKTIEIIGRLKFINLERPKKLFLMVGINDYLVNQGIWSHGLSIPFYKTYDVILDTLKTNLSDTQFYLLAIFPVNSGVVVEEKHINHYNKGIDEYNGIIEQMALKYNMHFLDFTRQFKDDQNSLRREYTLDGIHLNTEGYSLYFQLIKDLLM